MSTQKIKSMVFLFSQARRTKRASLIGVRPIFVYEQQFWDASLHFENEEFATGIPGLE